MDPDEIITQQRKAIASLREDLERSKTFQRQIAAQLHQHRQFVGAVRQTQSIEHVGTLLGILKENLENA